MKGRSENFLKFFEWSQDFLKTHNKKSTIVPNKTVWMDGIRVGGWCDGNEMVIAAKNPLFEQVYVHEFSHMQQAIEFSPLWKDDFLFWELLEKKKIGIRSWDAVLETIYLEQDCESRALSHSRKWQLFDNKEYARHANLYLYFYQYLFLKKEWKPSVKIYHPVLLAEMPEKLLPISAFNTIDMKLISLFEECLDKHGKFYKIGK